MGSSEKIVAEKADSPEQSTLRKARYHHGDLRAGLIEATRRLVEEKGPDGFSVSDACRLAGVSTAAPYKHFKDKNDMLVSMVLEGMERHRNDMLAALEPVPEGSPMRLKALGAEYIDFALREHGVFLLKFGGFSEALDDDRLQVAGEETFGIVLREVASVLGQTAITDEVRKRAFMLWSFVHGLSFILYDQKLRDMGGKMDVDALLADIARRVLSD